MSPSPGNGGGGGIDGGVLWRAGVVQLLAVLLLSLALAALLPRSFFEDWGWLSGSLAWLGCAALTARMLGLPTPDTLLGALLAGLLSGAAVLLGVHWLGVAIAIVVFAAWCARPRAAAAGPFGRRTRT
ncbi:MAG: hypothetical protein FJW90_07375 [Actinobacteria bacterium]|nr:hypothetical protein [Actinomycetota bacterium]